jgi:hypothetical protein
MKPNWMIALRKSKASRARILPTHCKAGKIARAKLLSGGKTRIYQHVGEFVRSNLVFTGKLVEQRGGTCYDTKQHPRE